MVFRRDNKPEFQRQMGALRQQLGSAEEAPEQTPEQYNEPRQEASYQAAPQRESYPPARDQGSYSFGSTYGSAAPAVQDQAMPAIPNVDAQTSVISNDTLWKGDLETRGSIHVHGRVEGTISAANEIYIADQAEVEATLTADGWRYVARRDGEGFSVTDRATGTTRACARLEDVAAWRD